MIEELKTVGIVILLTVPFFFLTVWAIVDCLQKDFGTIGKKALWGIIAASPFCGLSHIFHLRVQKRQKEGSSKYFLTETASEFPAGSAVRQTFACCRFFT